METNVRNKIKIWLSEKIMRKYTEVPKYVESCVDDISVYVLSHGLGGSMSQYVKSLINYYQKYNNVKFYTIEHITSIQKNIIMCDINMLLYKFENDNSKNLIVHVNTNPYFSEYGYKKIIDLILSKKECNVLISLHDLYWLCPSAPYIEITKIYKNLTSSENIGLANLLFNKASKILFPSSFIYNVYSKYFNFDRTKTYIIDNPDITVNKKYELYPQMTNVINILYLGSVSRIKGIYSVMSFLSEFAKLNNEYTIKLHILGKLFCKLPDNKLFIVEYHGEYEVENVFRDIKKIQPQIVLLPSISNEAWSYNSSLLISTGLPIFYNDIFVHNERIERTGRKNIAGYNDTDDTSDIIAKKLKLFIHYLEKNNKNDRYEAIIYAIDYPAIYKMLYKNTLTEYPRFYINIDKIVYINLDNRTDRRNEMIDQFSRLDIPNDKIVRFSAIRHSRGELGCTMSHIEVINTAIRNKWNNVLILEDDFNFIDDQYCIDEAFGKFNDLYGKTYDCFQLARGYAFIAVRDKDRFMKVKQCSTTSGYLLHSRIYKRLKNNFEESLRLFTEMNDDGTKYSLDVYWKHVQCTSNWFVYNPFLGYQRTSYSDIIKGYTIYDTVSGVEKKPKYVSVKMMGGLGNQLFQVATMYACGYEYKLVPIVKHFTEYSEGCSTKRISYFTSIMSKVKNIISRYYDQIDFCIISENSFGYNEIRLDDTKSYLLKGYFQSYKYFNKYRSEILELFDMGNMEKLLNDAYINITNGKKTISIHIRRGDYLKYSDIHFNLKLDYYKNALEYMNKINGDQYLILIFSDDIDWCKNQLRGENVQYVYGTYGINLPEEVIHMKLMSLCKHNIIANSTFSWWGAWLNKNSDKIVIAPKKWFTQDTMNNETDALFEPTWVLL